jgi:alpha,alpha-trehalose phosphorylase
VIAQRAGFADGSGDAPNEVLAAAAASAAGGGDTFDDAVAGNRRVLDDFWATADVELAGAADIARAVRFSTFQVFQAVSGNPGRASSAKGLTGQGYEGHHLWDQEIYLGQVLSALAPDAARRSLSFRCRTLPQARERAAQLSHDGAQYPWRTIDGTEASAFFPAGAAQHHLNADIAWAIEHYVATTGDDTLLADGGLDVLVETARLWMSLGRFDGGGQFHLDGVTGPDEYTALVDNNLFTNLMAAANLRAAADRLEATGAAATDEIAAWRRAAAAVVVPYDEALHVHGQDETFLRRERWDLAATPPEQFPLQDHHHLLTLYRRQVLKQADVVLALWLLHGEFTPEQRRRDFDYYEPLTTHDSSLSAPVHAVVAADVGHLDLAWRYTRDVALMDLEGRQGNLGDGIHLAAAAGAWLAIACGFGGYRVRDGRPAFRPQRPPGVERVCFRLRFRGAHLEVAMDGRGTSYRVLAGGPLTLLHGDEEVVVAPGTTVERPPPSDVT